MSSDTTPEFKLAADEEFRKRLARIQEAFAMAFQAHPEAHQGGEPQRRFQTIYAAALVQVAAGLAVDLGINIEVFGSLCRDSFERAYQAAPKFG
jgi:hypothetical protein